MAMTLYNTMSRRKEPFIPLDPPNVRMYCCGLTVYNYAHIGNLRTYIFEDILRRGNGADRQLRVFNANRDIVEVVREIANTTEVAAATAAA